MAAPNDGGLLVDRGPTLAYIAALNRPTGPLVIVLYPQKGKGPCIKIPCLAEAIPFDEVERRQRENPTHSLGVVVNPPRPRLPEWGEQRVFGASNSDIAGAVALFAECDGGFPIEEQVALIEEAGLPPPTFVVWSGRQSAHFYLVLHEGEQLTPEQFRILQKRIFSAIDQVAPEAKVDTSLSKPSQVMRIQVASILGPGSVARSTRVQAVTTGRQSWRG
ncbi:MAG: hypothetical protein WBM08_09415 [Prochlorococcaceae cyanobacterium]